MFVPLALAVGFAMLASYFLSITLVPILSAHLLKEHASTHGTAVPSSRFSFDRVRVRYGLFLQGLLGPRALVVSGYLMGAILVVAFFGSLLGTEIFPQSDEGQMTMRFRAPTGTRIEESEAIALRIFNVIKTAAGPNNVESTLAYVGAQPTTHPINAIYLWTSGPDEGVLQLQLRHGSGLRVEAFKETLRKAIAAQIPEVGISFEPSDIVSRVLSFGASTPVEVAVSGPDLAANREVAEKLKLELGKIPSLRDLQIGQPLDYPTLKIEVDREKAGMAGVTMKEVADSFVPATSSSRYVARNFWPDPKSGMAYLVEVSVPEEKMDSVEEVRNIPVARAGKKSMLMRNLADIKETSTLGEYDRYNLQRMIRITANISGSDLGRVSKAVRTTLAGVVPLPRGVSLALRGQVTTMEQMLGGLQAGLGVTVVAIFLLLTANFQSWRLAFVVVSTVPAVLAGVASTLWITGTTLNIQSFMGGIMSVGVAVANAILLITFAERFRKEGLPADQAAVEGAKSRLRPILMTTLAMIAGMIPMAIGASEGGEQAAPLGRAVIGGLAGSTVATLLILPVVFTMVQGRASAKSPSLDPDDSGSVHFAPTPEVKS